MIDFFMLPQLARIVKSGVSATLKYFCDLNIKGFYYLLYLLCVQIFTLLYVTCSVWFDNRKGRLSILQSSGHLLVYFAIYHYRSLV